MQESREGISSLRRGCNRHDANEISVGRVGSGCFIRSVTFEAVRSSFGTNFVTCMVTGERNPPCGDLVCLRSAGDAVAEDRPVIGGPLLVGHILQDIPSAPFYAVGLVTSHGPLLINASPSHGGCRAETPWFPQTNNT